MKVSTPESVKVFEAYPRKVKKPRALMEIMKAIDRDGFEKVYERTVEFTKRSKVKEMQFIPYPSTFYHNSMYLDDYDSMFPPERKNGHNIVALQITLKAKEKYRDSLRHKFSSEGPFGRQWSNDAKRLESKKLTEEINEINRKLAMI